MSQPKHIAIIMDGNRRWARRGGFLDNMGHRRGATTLHSVVEACVKRKIETVTLFGFSTENWSRSTLEVEGILHVIRKTLDTELPYLIEQKISFHVIGDRTRFDRETSDLFAKTEQMTAQGTQMKLVVALSYGGRHELLCAMKRCFSDLSLGKLKEDCLNESTFEAYLETAAFGHPDLVIRTGGEQRLSNFLLWQNAYAELYFTDVFWPDFAEEDLDKALIWYAQRKRRYGR